MRINNTESIENQYNKLLKDLGENLNDLIDDNQFIIPESKNKTFKKLLDMLIISYREGDKEFIENH